MRPDAPDAPAERHRGAGEGGHLPRRWGGRVTHLLPHLARARHSSGYPAGAVNAALGAISAAATGEEADAATSYLELLMERMAANDDDEDEDANDANGTGGGEVDRKDEKRRSDGTRAATRRPLMTRAESLCSASSN